MDIARYLHYKYGVPASVQIAQWVQETGFGVSKLSVVDNNDFGIKCFRKHCKDGHCVQHDDDFPNEKFRAFKSKEESWQYHARMVTSGRYKKLLRHGNDWRKWCEGLQEVGYATDGQYSSKLIQIIKKYNLQRYDGL